MADERQPQRRGVSRSFIFSLIIVIGLIVLFAWMIFGGRHSSKTISINEFLTYLKSGAITEVTETPVVKEDNEEALYTQQCESLYKTFTTKDLSFADVHGFVKSIEFRLNDFIIKIGFDKEGNINKFQLYDWDKSDFVAARITRNSDGAIVAIDNTSEKNKNSLSILPPFGRWQGGENIKNDIVIDFIWDI